MAEYPRAAQLIGGLERAGDAVAELDPPPWVVCDADLASCMVAPGQVKLHLPKPIASECRPDRVHVLAVRLRELHGLEASRGSAVEPLPERVLREKPFDVPAPDVRGKSEHGVRVRASAARLARCRTASAVCLSVIRSVFRLLRAITTVCSGEKLKKRKVFRRGGQPNHSNSAWEWGFP